MTIAYSLTCSFPALHRDPRWPSASGSGLAWSTSRVPTAGRHLVVARDDVRILLLAFLWGQGRRLWSMIVYWGAHSISQTRKQTWFESNTCSLLLTWYHKGTHSHTHTNTHVRSYYVSLHLAAPHLPFPWDCTTVPIHCPSDSFNSFCRYFRFDFLVCITVSIGVQSLVSVVS